MAAKSMTGYGAMERQNDRFRVRVELRSVNHRFLEVQLNLPSVLLAHETPLRNAIGARVRRARVDGWLSWEPREASRHRVEIDRDLIQKLSSTLEAARAELGVQGDVTIDLVTRFPEVVKVVPAVDALDEAALDEVKACLEVALDELDRARAAEGAALVVDITARFDALETLVASAKASVATEPARLEARLRERISTLLNDVKLDDARLHQEIAYLVDRSDVSEEITRLEVHLARARELLGADGELGKPLDFLVQEIGRETNTLGSKSRAPETSGLVLAMKAELEKIREQARNLE